MCTDLSDNDNDVKFDEYFRKSCALGMTFGELCQAYLAVCDRLWRKARTSSDSFASEGDAIPHRHCCGWWWLIIAVLLDTFSRQLTYLPAIAPAQVL